MGSYSIRLNREIRSRSHDECYGIDADQGLKQLIGLERGATIKLSTPDEIEPFKQIIDDYEKKRKPIDILKTPQTQSYCNLL